MRMRRCFSGTPALARAAVNSARVSPTSGSFAGPAAAGSCTGARPISSVTAVIGAGVLPESPEDRKWERLFTGRVDLGERLDNALQGIGIECLGSPPRGPLDGELLALAHRRYDFLVLGRAIRPGTVAIGEELILLVIDAELDGRVLLEWIADDRRHLVAHALARPVGDEQEGRVALGILRRLRLGLGGNVADLAVLGLVGVGRPVAKFAKRCGLGRLRQSGRQADQNRQRRQNHSPCTRLARHIKNLTPAACRSRNNGSPA